MQLCLVIVCMFVFCVMSNIMLHHAKVSSYVGVCIFKKTTCCSQACSARVCCKKALKAVCSLLAVRGADEAERDAL